MNELCDTCRHYQKDLCPATANDIEVDELNITHCTEYIPSDNGIEISAWKIIWILTIILGVVLLFWGLFYALLD